jgi:Asp-tRNA(Asn)/Glu-tRNA(Gln) amidotransferase A subunit family amidase
MSSLFLDKSIPELMEGVRSGSLSFEDFSDATVQTIASHESSVLAWVTFDLEELRLESESAWLRMQARGCPLALDGLPFGVKDIFNTKLFPTQMGSPLWKDFTPGNDARVVDSVRLAGGIVVGKTVTAEFAVHALNETLNPHDASKTPGTSSSGSAVSVATGMVPFALATQTAGSIIRPSSFCGVWGMKPSFGMIPRTGALKTTDSLDTIGFIAAHGKSLRPILDSTRVKGPDYPYVYRHVDKRGAFPKNKSKPWRVGFLKTHIWDTAEPYACLAIEGLASKIGGLKGFEVAELLWPTMLHTSHSIHETIYNKSLSYYFKSEYKSALQITPIMKEMIELGDSISPERFRTALLQQERYCEDLNQLIQPYDFIISLATSSSAPPRGIEELPDPSLIWTLGHLPTVAAPAFQCPQGLPFAVQFTSSRWNDYLLLQGVEELISIGVLEQGSKPIPSTIAKG